MELDEMKSRWMEIEQRLDAIDARLELGRFVGRTGVGDRARSKLRFVHAVLWFEIASGGLIVLLIGSYLADNIGTPRFAIPAALMHLGAILLIGLALRQLVALKTIDFAGSVVVMQRRLTEVGVIRARANRWLLIASPLIWSLLVIVVPHGLLGFDIYTEFGLPWVAGNLAFGVAAIAAVAWVSRRFPDWYRDSAFVRGLGDDLTGRRVAAASGFLREIAEFETEA